MKFILRKRKKKDFFFLFSELRKTGPWKEWNKSAIEVSSYGCIEAVIGAEEKLLLLIRQKKVGGETTFTVAIYWKKMQFLKLEGTDKKQKTAFYQIPENKKNFQHSGVKRKINFLSIAEQDCHMCFFFFFFKILAVKVPRTRRWSMQVQQ